MYRRLVIAIFLILASVVNGLSANQIAHYGSIIFPVSFSNPLPIQFLYKGTFYSVEIEKTTSPKKAVFEVQESPLSNTFYYIFTRSLRVPESLAIDGLETSQDHPYRIFEIKAEKYDEAASNTDLDVAQTSTVVPINKKPTESTYVWVIKELDNSRQIIRIPDNSFVFFMEPSWITVQPTFFDIHQPFRALPPIIFKGNLLEADYIRTANELLCSAIDVRAFHTKPTPYLSALANSQTVVRVPIAARQFRAS